MKKRQFLNINTINELALQLKLPVDFLVKLADRIDNTKTIVAHDAEFAKIYMAEKRLLLGVIGDGDKVLWDDGDGIIWS